jgi:endogenous inhibitor of DNA gyrase (YacG/DUF329 family)
MPDQTVFRQIACPSCGAQTTWCPENPWRPFCSERCKLIDLGAWASTAYRIASPVAEEEKTAED